MALKAKKPTTFRLWRDECNLTRKQAAAKLGLSESQTKKLDYAETTSGNPQKPSKERRYAMRAIALGLDPWPE